MKIEDCRVGLLITGGVSGAVYCITGIQDDRLTLVSEFNQRQYYNQDPKWYRSMAQPMTLGEE